MASYLLMVARDRLGLREYWTRCFEGLQEVQVITDRRWGERRHDAQVHEPERRRADRRRQPWVDQEIWAGGFKIIPAYQGGTP